MHKPDTKVRQGERAQAHCPITRTGEAQTGFGDLAHHSAGPLLSPTLEGPGESGFPKSLAPRLLPAVAWSLPALSRLCPNKQRQGQFAAKWFWGREQLPPLGIQWGDQGVSEAAQGTRRAGPYPEPPLRAARSPGSCQAWRRKARTFPITSPRSWHQERTHMCL